MSSAAESVPSPSSQRVSTLSTYMFTVPGTIGLSSVVNENSSSSPSPSSPVSSSPLKVPIAVA